MAEEVRAVAGAFAYAWWLTGDEEGAEHAVRAALAAATPADEAALLTEVRRRAISDRTMCPASELALLHDAHGLPLTAAARLCDIDERDATTELAHGRLEALLEAPEADFAHPERLGGLASGNPADVAHSRQCGSCGEVRALLDQGRRELGEVAAQVVAEHPEALSSVRAHAGLAGDDEGAPAWPPPAPAEPAAEATPAKAAGPRVAAALLALSALAVVSVAFVQARSDDPAAPDEPTPPEGEAAADLDPGEEDDPDAAAPSADEQAVPEGDPGEDAPGEGDPGEGDPGAEDPDGEPVPEVEVPGEAEADEARIVGVELGGADDGRLRPDEPLRVAVAYEGAEPGTQLRGDWTVDGEPFRSLDASLRAGSGTHVIGERVPPAGWPSGAHRVLLLIGEDGAQVGGVITFEVE